LSSTLADRRTELLQGSRYALVGVLVGALYVAVTSVAHLAHAPWWLAVAIGYVFGTTTHFTLQRVFVFKSDTGFALSMRQQAVRYLAVVVVQYVITSTAMTFLPDLIDLPELLIFVGVAGAVAIANFVLLRTRLFHAA